MKRRRYGDWLKAAKPKMPNSTKRRLQESGNDSGSEEESEPGRCSANQPAVITAKEDPRSAVEQSLPKEIGQDLFMLDPEAAGLDLPDMIEGDNNQVFLEEQLMDMPEPHFESFELPLPLNVIREQPLLEEMEPEAEEQAAFEPELSHSGRQPRKPRKGLNDQLHPALSVTGFECLLAIIHFGMRHGLTSVAIKDLLQLINLIFGEEVIPESEEIFKNIFRGSFLLEYYFCCLFCGKLLGEKASFKGEKNVKCTVCHKVTNVANLCENNFFVYIPLEQQLRNLFEHTPDILSLLEYRKRREVNLDCISDVFDGCAYKSLSIEGGVLSDHKNFSVTVNTDGSPIFKSSSNTMYPIQLRINEFPPEVRFESWNCLVGGIWFGKHDPEMSAFLQPFVKEAEKLFKFGFKWKPLGQEEQITSKMVTLNNVLDSVAKPKVQQLMQFNAYFGCNYCEHPGIKIEEHNHPRYLMPDDFDVTVNDKFESEYSVTWVDPKTKVEEQVEVKDRSNENIRTVMDDIQHDRVKGPVRGVIGCSPLFPLLYFDLCFGFCIDYMHAVLIGVCKLVTTLQLQTKSKMLPFYIGDHIAELDKRLSFMKPPSSFSRNPRSMKDIIHWKANEWRSYLLYYSLPSLDGILGTEYLKHHCLLVSGMYILLKDKITKEELRQASLYLKSYVCDFQRLYGAVNMNFNVHLLLHICKCVSMFGPVWTFSAFCFESGNGRLVRLVKGTRFVAKQIAEKYVDYACIPETMSMYKKISDDVLHFCENMFSFARARYSIKINDVTLLGDMQRFKASDEEKNCFNLAKITPQPFSYSKVIKDGVMYFASLHRDQNVKIDDSAVKLSDNSYAYIERIVNVVANKKSEVYVVCRSINCKENSPPIVQHEMGASASFIKLCNLIAFGKLFVCPARNIKSKVLLMLDNGATFKNSYVIEVLHHLEKD